MRRADLIAASVVVVAAMLGAALAVGLTTPPGMRLPVHWGVTGAADGFAGKWAALLWPPALTTGLVAGLVLLPTIEPRVRQSAGLYRALWAGMLLVVAAADLAVVAAARAGAPRGLPFVAVGVMLLLVGNQLGKSRPMRFVGIRTPWTRASVDTWIATHRLGGRLMIAAGLACLTFAAAGAPATFAAYVVAGVVAAAVVPVAYSYVDWSRRTRG